jgi:hypothetical protein
MKIYDVLSPEVYYASFTLSRHLYYLSLKLNVSCVPSRDDHEWLLYGDEYSGMKSAFS